MRRALRPWRTRPRRRATLEGDQETARRNSRTEAGNPLLPWLGIAAAIGAAALVAWAGGTHGARLGGVPAFAVCAAAAFAIQWLMFVPAYLRQTERFFDLTGAATYLCVAALALLAAPQPDLRALLIAAMTGIWAARLGVFLSARVRRDGFDRRFARILPDFATLLMTWTLQGLWVTVAFGPGIAAIVATSPPPADALLALGVVMWIAGFAIEVAADQQKKRFRARPENAERFIASGLWAWSRHPNYFGEILLWTGIAVAALPALEGWQHATLISPVFVYLLLTRISGVRMLEARADRRWANDASYARYRADTPMLVLRPPKPRPDDPS